MVLPVIFVQSNIALLTEMLANAAEREAFLSKQEQDTLNERVSRRVIGKIVRHVSAADSRSYYC